ncbi:MAG: hypothetical protein ACLQVY_27050 [Limisphaerales bacterium]
MLINPNASSSLGAALLQSPASSTHTQHAEEQQTGLSDSLQRLSDPAIQENESSTPSEQDANDALSFLTTAMAQQPGAALSAHASSLWQDIPSLL